MGKLQKMKYCTLFTLVLLDCYSSKTEYVSTVDESLGGIDGTQLKEVQAPGSPSGTLQGICTPEQAAIHPKGAGFVKTDPTQYLGQYEQYLKSQGCWAVGAHTDAGIVRYDLRVPGSTATFVGAMCPINIDVAAVPFPVASPPLSLHTARCDEYGNYSWVEKVKDTHHVIVIYDPTCSGKCLPGP